jgi:hypothetical protein
VEGLVRQRVRERANHLCEYCLRAQSTSLLIPFHVEHVIPRKHGGLDAEENLALACAECNLRKSSDLAGFDPETQVMTRLFNPRVDRWDEHFAWDDSRIVGLTAIGRTTVRVLDLNSSSRIRLRMTIRRV